MTYALREARDLAACALAAQIARAIALTALAALGISSEPFHEALHAGSRQRCSIVTNVVAALSSQRRR
jgi:hypothetical protein